MDPLSLVARTLIDPPADWISETASGTADFLNGVAHSSQLSEENRRLRQIAVAESLYNQRIEDLEREIADLRKFESMPVVPGRKRIPARIVGVFPDENRITLNAGEADGVPVGVPVIAPDGLLAIVQTVDRHSCQAVLEWSPLPFKMGATVLHTPEVAGLLHGDSTEHLMLDLPLGSQVKPGDLVITSGFSEKIPRGIPIGRVSAVQQDLDYGTERAEIAPDVQLGDIQEVFVLG